MEVVFFLNGKGFKSEYVSWSKNEIEGTWKFTHQTVISGAKNGFWELISK